MKTKEAKRIIKLLSPVHELHYLMIHSTVKPHVFEPYKKELIEKRPGKVDTLKGSWFIVIKELGDTLPPEGDYEWAFVKEAPRMVISLVESLIDQAQKTIGFWASHSWGRGIRCHGYWQGQNRVGFIGLSPPFQKPTIYHWSVDVPKENAYSGQCSTLKEAKKQVEEKYKEGLKKALLSN